MKGYWYWIIYYRYVGYGPYEKAIFDNVNDAIEFANMIHIQTGETYNALAQMYYWKEC